MASYMILLRGSFAEWQKLGPDEIQRLMQKYTAWVETLRSERKFKDGAPLTNRSRMLRPVGRDVAVIDGPYAESKEAVTGYFIIESESLEAATELARGCPALLHGDSVEVAELGN